MEVDELWGFIGKKKYHANRADRAQGLGDVWYEGIVFVLDHSVARPLRPLALRLARGRWEIWSMQPNKILPPQGVLSSIDGCECVHVASEPVHEVFQGQTAWQGTVEVFEIIDHPRAKRVYTWAYEDDDGQIKTITVLEIPPVDSPQTAVKVAIAAKAKSQK